MNESELISKAECKLEPYLDAVDANILQNTFDYTVLRFDELVLNKT